jgi:hypothetical protein
METPHAFGKANTAELTLGSFLHGRESVSTERLSNNKSSRQYNPSTIYYTQAMPAKMRNGLVQPSVPHKYIPYQIQGHLQKPPAHAISQAIPRQHSRITKNAATDILPYCTTEPPLRDDKVIALSDTVGSMKELVLLALGAAEGDRSSSDRLAGAVGAVTASSIVEFFVGEWEVE